MPSGPGRLLNTVAHHHHTLERERALGVDHWDVDEHGYVCHHHCIAGELRFRGDFEHPSAAIDYRVYLPRLMEDFEERGGRLVIQPVAGVEEIERLSERHDLMVVAVGRRSVDELFARRADKSPYDRPQRRLSAGIYSGIEYSEPKGVGVHFAPGHGELLELPIYSHDGFATALLFENVPGGALERLADIRYDDDPAALRRARARDAAHLLPDGRRARRSRVLRPVVGPRPPPGRAHADRARGLRAPEQRPLRAGRRRRAHRRRSR